MFAIWLVALTTGKLLDCPWRNRNPEGEMHPWLSVYKLEN
jgi:hypothetical protein